jgi:hypothetical protein
VVPEGVWWKTEKRHTKPRVVAYRQLYCKQYYRRVWKGRRQTESAITASYRRRTKVANAR